MADSDEINFRGILDLEWSLWLAMLTQKTHNVTVILDCCHSGHLCRMHGLQKRSLSEIWQKGVANRLAWLRAEYDLSLLHLEGNPYVVRLAAAGMHQSAFEYKSSRYGQVGLFTEALSDFFAEIDGEEVTWNRVGQVVREKVLGLCAAQRPESEGPINRLLFDMNQARAQRRFAVFHTGDPLYPEYAIRGGRVHGVCAGNRYGIMPAGSSGWCKQKALAQTEITSVTALSAALRIDEGEKHLPAGSIAFPLFESFAPLEVAIDPELREHIEPLIAASDLLTTSQSVGHAVRIENTCTGMVLYNAMNQPYGYPERDQLRVLAQLENLARAHFLRRMEKGGGSSVHLDLGRVTDQGLIPLSTFGEEVYLDDRIYLKITNQGNDLIYANLLDIGVGGKITLLSRSHPSGVALRTGEHYLFGKGEYQEIAGVSPGWPANMPRETHAIDTLMVLATSEPIDLRIFESGPFLHRPRKTWPKQLQLLMTPGAFRDFSPEETDDHLEIHHIELALMPRNRQQNDLTN